MTTIITRKKTKTLHTQIRQLKTCYDCLSPYRNIFFFVARNRENLLRDAGKWIQFPSYTGASLYAKLSLDALFQKPDLYFKLYDNCVSMWWSRQFYDCYIPFCRWHTDTQGDALARILKCKILFFSRLFSVMMKNHCQMLTLCVSSSIYILGGLKTKFHTWVDSWSALLPDALCYL